MAITAVNIQPWYWSSLYNPVVWTVTSNQVLNSGFKYVFDIYVDDVFKTRIKQQSNPGGYGIIDVSRIVRNYISISDFDIDFKTNTALPLKSGENLTKRFKVLIGEEYLVGSNYFTYNGITNTTPQNPAYDPNTSTYYPIGIVGALDPYTYKSSLLTNRGSAYPSVNYSLQDREAMTRWNYVNAQSVYSYDKQVLTFMSNMLSQSPGLEQLRYIYIFRIDFYNSSDDRIDTIDVTNLQSEGGGPWEVPGTDYDTMTLPDSKYGVISIGIGPANNPYGASLPVGTTYYTIKGYLPQIDGSGHITGLVGLAATRSYRFNLNDCENDPAGFTRVRLTWLNDLGGCDSYNFTKANTDELSNVKSSYYTLPESFSGIWSYNPNSGGDMVYSSDITVGHEISTDWLTEEESIFLKSLFKSPRVLAYFTTSPTELARPVTITDTSFQVQTYARNKMFQHTFKIKESNNLPAQSI